MNVLLVDDDAEIRLLVSHVLMQAGHAVHEAADGAAAAALLASVRFDVVLFDVMLGLEDGIALAAQLLPGGDGPRLVFLTGATRPDQLERMRALGAAAIVQKPFDPMTLTQRIGQLVGAKS